MMRLPIRAADVFVAAVSVGSFVALGLLASRGGVGVTSRNWVECLLLFAFVAVTEFRSIKVPRGDEVGEITPSAAFAVALLLVAGPVAAAIALGLSSVVADVAAHKVWWKIVFNAAQYGVALLAGAATLALLTGESWLTGLPHVTGERLIAVLVAGLVFSVTNLLVTEIAVALAQGRGILTDFFGDFVFEMSTAAIFTAMAPVAVVLADRSLVLVPLLALPLAAMYRSTALSMDKDYQSLHDVLTGLPNRALFRDRVEQAVLSGRREGTCQGIMIIDLDRFKEVNDTLGHHIGDLLLKEIGPRLVPLLRASDTVARLGGDEFGVLVRGVGGPTEVEAIASKLIHALQQPFEVKGIKLDIDGSVGIALCPAHGEQADVLIQRADVAMYRAKENHQGWETYSPDHDEHSMDRLVLVGDLRRAIDNDELVLHYQPKVDLATREVTGVEALVRWQHPTRGVVYPDDFIPLAERTGMMRSLTLQVLGSALRQCFQWRQQSLGLTVAVNISAKNLHDLDLPRDVGRLLEDNGVPAAALELEVTETAVMADPAQAMGVLVRLHEMGVRLSIDDYGTGYASLAYLKRLPVDEIKIDKSFVINLIPGSDDAIIVKSTVEMARSLGLAVLAEGVEGATAMEYLRDIGCDGAQGYFWSRPMPSADVAGWVKAWRDGLRRLAPQLDVNLGYEL